MTNENESLYLKWPFFGCMSHRQNGNFGIQVHTMQEPNITWDHVNLGLCKDNLYMIYLRCPFTQPVKKNTNWYVSLTLFLIKVKNKTIKKKKSRCFMFMHTKSGL